MPIGVSDNKTSFSHLLAYIIDSPPFLKDILCCSLATRRVEYLWVLDSVKLEWIKDSGQVWCQWLPTHSINTQSPDGRWKAEKKRANEKLFLLLFFFESTKGSVCSQTLWQTSIRANPPSPPQPTETDLTTWSNIQLQVRCFIHHLLCFCHHFNFPLFTEAWDIWRF